jgi:hypothetical protein
MDIGFSSDFCVYVWFGSDLFMNIGFSSDFSMDVGFGSWVDLTGIIVWVDECWSKGCVMVCYWGRGNGGGYWGSGKSWSSKAIAVSSESTISTITITSIWKPIG